MHSIQNIYRIGYGPSSSHTMGPSNAAEQFLSANKTAKHFKCTLYGSLAATGKGHLTDFIVDEVFKQHPLEIIWEPDVFLPYHPNALYFEAYSEEGGDIEAINFDVVVETMFQTGKDLSSLYKETSKGGLACYNALPKY